MPALGFHAHDHAASALQVGHHIAHQLLRYAHLHFLDRLHQLRVGLGERILECHGTGDLETDVVAVHRVHLAVVDDHLHVARR